MASCGVRRSEPFDSATVEVPWLAHVHWPLRVDSLKRSSSAFGGSCGKSTPSGIPAAMGWLVGLQGLAVKLVVSVVGGEEPSPAAPVSLYVLPTQLAIRPVVAGVPPEAAR